MLELIKKLLMFLSGLRPAPVKNKAVLDIEPVPVPDWPTLEQFRLSTGLSAGKAFDWYQHVRSACIQFDIVGPVRIPIHCKDMGQGLALHRPCRRSFCGFFWHSASGEGGGQTGSPGRAGQG